MYYVYLLQNRDNDNDFYLGYSSDLKERFKQHNAGRNASTRGRAWRLVYYEAYSTADAARERERRLKHDGRVRRFLMDRVRRYLSGREAPE